MFDNVEIKEIKDLESKAIKGNLNWTSTPKTGEAKYNVEDFFYTPQAAAPTLTKESVSVRLATIFNLTEFEFVKITDETQLKRLYRQAALRLHPDRNGGEASQMSELNMLWNVYNSKGV